MNDVFKILGLIKPRREQFRILYKETKDLLQTKINNIDEYKFFLSSTLYQISSEIRNNKIDKIDLSVDEKIVLLTYFYLFDSVNFYITYITLYGSENPPVSSNRINEGIICQLSKLESDKFNVFIGQCYNNNLLRQIA